MKRKNKTIMRVLCCTLGAVTALSVATGCGNEKEPSSQTPSADYSLWGAPITEKVLQNVHTYDALKTDASLTIDTAKNEYESGQIILTANAKVNEYTVTVSDLKQVGGDAIYESSNISVYNMMYTYVESPWNADALIGWYPDGILPMEAAVKAGENTVEAGNNQSIYFSFFTPEEQATGTYEGKASITVDGEEEIVPIRLRVRNVSVSEKRHQQSMFINSWHYYIGEYDGTQAMFEKYIDMMLDYRVAPTSFVFETSWTEQDAEYYAEKAYEYGADDRCSNIAIPISKGDSGIKEKQFTTYLLALAKKSMATKFDLLAKCCVYGIDEPLANNAFDKTKAFAVTFEQQRNDAIAALEEKKSEYLITYGIEEVFFDTMIESIRDIHYITTTRYTSQYEEVVDVWCPTFVDFESGLATGVYENEEELWWYGALSPKKPYPTYHICDVLVSSRMIGWLQAIYGIVGNIYWGYDIYGSYSGNAGETWTYRDEYYQDASRFLNVNGDGFLVYPGKKYGIDGPIASIRLESIRDGYEEYELLYALKEQYAAVSQEIGVEFSALSTIADMASSLYTGTQITATNDSFCQAREQILNLSEFTQSGACFTSYKDDGEGKIEYELYIPNGVEVTVSGITAAGETAATGGKIVRYVADMTASNIAEVARFETIIDGEKVAVERYLSGAVSKFEAESLEGSFTGATATLVNAQEVSTGLVGKLLQFELPTVEDNMKQEVKLINKALLSKLGSNVEKLVFNIWSECETEVPVTVFVKYKNKVYKESIASSAFILKEGINQIAWENLSTINWAKNGELEYIVFAIGEYGEMARSDIYFKNAVIYSKKEDT